MNPIDRISSKLNGLIRVSEFIGWKEETDPQFNLDKDKQQRDRTIGEILDIVYELWEHSIDNL